MFSSLGSDILKPLQIPAVLSTKYYELGLLSRASGEGYLLGTDIAQRKPTPR